MCLSFGRICTILQILWSTVYVICGSAQLMIGIFVTVTVHELQLYSILVAGIWNIIVGIAGGMISCITAISPRRQEILLYVAVSVLMVNAGNLILTEWELYFTDMPKMLRKYANYVLIDYAFFLSRIATATVLLVAFVDSQLAFCSMQTAPIHATKKKKTTTTGSHEHVSDIEYIIPRPKPSKPQHTVYNAYAQSWVFDAENAGCSTTVNAETPYLKILENGTQNSDDKTPEVLQNGMSQTTASAISNPMLHVEEPSDDSTSNSDRKINHMKSFSRSATPIILSASSSQLSLSATPIPPIYACLEKLTDPAIYRSRLDTAVSTKDDDTALYQSPQTNPKPTEKVQYASLMKELQRAIVNKKEPSSVTSPLSSDSDAEFSKELEAALQLIQDLESPNAPDTPSTDAKPNEGQELSTFKPPTKGKGASVAVRCPESQSTSGYSSPTPVWSTTSSVNGSTGENVGYSICSADSSTVISLYSPAMAMVAPPPRKTRAVTLVQITGEEVGLPPQASKVAGGGAVWSLLRKKKQSTPPRLCPELEGAIVKSESLAYLSEVELLARHQRNKEIQREIEERVIQQLSVPKGDFDSSC